MKRDLLERLNALETKQPEQENRIEGFAALISSSDNQDPAILKFKNILTSYEQGKACLGQVVTAWLVAKHH